MALLMEWAVEVSLVLEGIEVAELPNAVNETLTVQPGWDAYAMGVVVGVVALVAAGAIVQFGKGGVNKWVVAVLLGGIGLVFVLSTVGITPYKSVSSDGRTLRIAGGLFGKTASKTVDLNAVTMVRVYKVRRRSARPAKRRRLQTVVELHRLGSDIEYVNMSGNLREPVLEHMLVKLRERSVVIKDERGLFETGP